MADAEKEKRHPETRVEAVTPPIALTVEDQIRFAEMMRNPPALKHAKEAHAEWIRESRRVDHWADINFAGA